jgi:hypothetical protein
MHRWLLATPDGCLDWHGEQAVRLASGRFLVILHALCLGRCAVFDTGTSELVPLDLRTPEECAAD